MVDWNKNKKFKFFKEETLKKNIIFIVIGFLILFTMFGCDGGGIIPDDDNNNDDSNMIKNTVLIEAYIAVGCSACAKVEPILEQLVNEYSREEMILVEIDPWSDYHTVETSQRYKWYGLTGGVPQILFNGLNNNIAGSSGATYSAIKSRIEAQLAINPTIKLEASRTTTSSGTVISGKVKNISSNTLTNLVVNGMVFKDMGKVGFRYTVTDIFEDEKIVINSLAPGEEKDFTMTIAGLKWGTKDDGVIFVQSIADPKKTIRQSVFLD